MSSIITVKRAVTVVSVSAAILCASAATYFIYKRRKGRNRRAGGKSTSPSRKGLHKGHKGTASTRKSDDKVHQSDGVPASVGEANEERSGYTSDVSTVGSDGGGAETGLKHRGRNDQRRRLRSKNKPAAEASISPNTTESSSSTSAAPQSQVDAKPQDQASSQTNAKLIPERTYDEALATTEQNQQQLAQFGAGGIPAEEKQRSWTKEDDDKNVDSSASSEAEIASSTVINRESASATLNGGLRGQQNGCGGNDYALRQQHQVRQQQQAPSPAVSSNKSSCTDSPSLGSDLHSEASQDSGKGASMGVTSSMTPVDLIEVPPVYEFEVPRDIVGLLIGKKGTTIKWLSEQSQAYIVIREHFYSDKHKICTLEGSREQINKCLRLIRRKFPPSRFPELRLTPILPPPVSTPRTPVWDNVVQLNLPEGVNCEVAVSSINNVGHVFLQQPTHPTFPSLSRLDQYMLTVYGQPAGVPPLPRPIEMAVICAAPVLGGWYRAQTIDYYDDTDEALVKFVDYGGYCRVSASDLRQIRSDFMTLPFQATECYLAHIAPADEEEGWSQDALSLFEQLCVGKVIEAKVTGHANDNMPLVELYTWTEESKSVMVNHLLKDRGYAVLTD